MRGVEYISLGGSDIFLWEEVIYEYSGLDGTCRRGTCAG
jgi:hypothetical protein